MILGSTSVAVYAVVASFSLPAWGVVAGSAVAWIASSCLISLPAGLWLRSR